jgi:hypothetical protein
VRHARVGVTQTWVEDRIYRDARVVGASPFCNYWRRTLKRRCTLVKCMLCAGLFLPYLMVMPLTAISGNSRFLGLDHVLEPIAGVDLTKEVFTSRVR